MLRALPLCVTLACPVAAAAHPHVFVDTGLEFIVDAQGNLTAVRVAWAYDELYSLLVLEEHGADSDYDGQVTAEERALLQGFDMNWIEGFEGDLYLSGPDGPLALLGPTEGSVDVEDGRVVSSHTRTLATPIPAAGIVAKAYDPTFYTAYEVTRGATASGTGCTVAVTPPNLDAAYTMLEELLYGPRSAEFDEDNFPEVGEAFADEVVLTCASGS